MRDGEISMFNSDTSVHHCLIERRCFAYADLAFSGVATTLRLSLFNRTVAGGLISAEATPQPKNAKVSFCRRKELLWFDTNLGENLLWRSTRPNAGTNGSPTECQRRVRRSHKGFRRILRIAKRSAFNANRALLNNDISQPSS